MRLFEEIARKANEIAQNGVRLSRNHLPPWALRSPADPSARALGDIRSHTSVRQTDSSWGLRAGPIVGWASAHHDRGGVIGGFDFPSFANGGRERAGHLKRPTPKRRTFAPSIRTG